MNKQKFQIIKDITIYPINYLINEELTDTDLSNLLDNNKVGLTYSLIFGMFKFMKSPKRNYQILKMIESDSTWYDKIKWTQSERDQYEKIIIDIYKNVYQYNGMTAITLAQWFITIYGFSLNDK